MKLGTFLYVACVSTTCFSHYAFANKQGELDQNNQTSKALEEVVVTGSHILRQGTETPTPVSVLDRSMLDVNGHNLLADTLNQLPSTGKPTVSQTTSNFNVFSAGISTINLRNLNDERTLVLVNGRRHVGGWTLAPNVVDLNSIPAEFIDRIEIVTGGTSAVYGSEAVAGVVNIITKDNLDGISIRAQSGISEEGDGSDQSLSISGGHPFAEGNGQAMFHLGYSKIKEVYARDREFSKYDERLGNYQDFSPYAPQGAILGYGGQAYTLAEDDSWTKVFNSAEDGFNRAEYRLLQVPLERKDIAFNVDYEITDDINFFIESSYTQTSSFTHIEPTVTGQAIRVGDQALTIPSDNPFVPQEVLDTWTNSGDPEAVIPTNLTYQKRFSELGPRISEQLRDTTRIIFGLEGVLGDWQWDTYYQWGQTVRNQYARGHFNSLYFQQALDVEADPENPGDYRCREALARSLGCVPINVFGEGSISQEGVDYVAVDSQDRTVIEQQVSAFNIRGSAIDLPAGKVRVATGIELRKESLNTIVDTLAATGLSSSNNIAPVKGSYDVNEAYIEIDVPLVSEMSFIDHLSLNAAYRVADYSIFGGLDSWKAGVEWQPFDSLRFRAVSATSVRAPNLHELFNPGGETFAVFVDPCINGGSDIGGTTQVNCTSLGIPADWNPGQSGTFAVGTVSGNRSLKEETADTTTIGFVFTPNFLEGFSLTVDYFDIEIEDAIDTVDPQIKLSGCYASENFPDSPFCSGIVRNGADLNFVTKRLDFGLENIGFISTSGVDIELNYRTSSSFGDLDITTMITKTNDWDREVNGRRDSNFEEPGFQKWKATNTLNYILGPWSAGWTMSYIGSGVVDNTFSTDTWSNNDKLNQETYHNLRLAYTLDLDAKYEFYAGIRNLTNNKPPYIPTPSANSVQGTTTASGVYDIVGRFFYIGTKISF